MRSLIKSIFQGGVAALAPWVWRFRPGSHLLVLMYHRVLPKGHPALASEQAGMYVTPESLRMQLAVLARHFTFVHLDDWAADAQAGRPLPRNACAITFDDGWRDNFDFAWPVLRAAGVPATIFLVSDLIGTSYRFWPNRLAAVLAATPAADVRRALPPRLAQQLRDLAGGASEGPLDDRSIDRAIEACKDLSDREMDEIVGELESRLRVASQTKRDLLDWSEINAMSETGLVRFGSHTRHHCRLTGSVDPGVLRDEIEESQTLLAKHLGREVSMFCYPNGDHTPVAVELVRARYRAAVTTARGWNTAADDQCLLRRVGIHEDVTGTARAFLARIAC